MCGNGSADEPKEEKDKQPSELCGEAVHPAMFVSAVYGPGSKHGPEHGDDGCYDKFNHDVVVKSDASVERIAWRQV